MSNILITGGLGHIGSFLIDNIASKRLCIVDNLSSQRYISLIQTKKKFQFIEADFESISVDLLKQFDIVIHLAAITDATNSFQHRNLIQRVNVDQTIDFIKKCEEAQVKLIFPSSTSVYGKTLFEVDETNTDAIHPQSPYAEAKLNIEKLLPDIHSNYMILRLATICGISPGMRFHTAINKLCYQAAFHQPLTIWKENFEMYRPYLTLTHLCLIINRLIWAWDEKNNNTIYNVVSSNERLKDIVNHISYYLPYIQLNFIDCPLLNQYSYKVIHRLIEKVTDIKLKPYDIYDEITNTLKHLRAIE